MSPIIGLTGWPASIVQPAGVALISHIQLMAERIRRLSLRLGPSRLLVAMLAGAHILAAAALWLAPLPVAYALCGSILVSAHLAWVTRRHALRADAGALIALEVLEDGSVSVCTRAGSSREYRVAESSFVSPLLTVLSLRPDNRGRTRHVLIAADSVDADTFRRLRVWLRWRDAAPSAGLAPPREASRR